MPTVIRIPPSAGPKITLRFVRHRGISGNAIAWHDGVVVPFVPSHVECVTPEGRHLGMFGSGRGGQPAGMQDHPAGYDAGEVTIMLDGRPADLWVDLPATQAQADAFYAAARSAIGEPYDWAAILGFAPIPIRLHSTGHSICSAKQAALLGAVGWFPRPLVMPDHEISPAILLLILSAIVEVPR